MFKNILLSILLIAMTASPALAQSFLWRYQTHATDCTSLTGGKLRDLCYEQDAQTLYKCVPSAGDCDTAGEWKSAGGGVESNDLETTDPPNVTANEFYIGTGAATGAWVTLSGDATNALGVVTVVDDLHAHTTTSVSGLVDGDVSDTLTSSLVTVADTADATSFVALFESATGDLAPKSDGGILYDASTGDLVPTLVAGIANASLVDKTATEVITGAWDFSTGNLESPNSTAVITGDCDAAIEAGRVYVDTDATTGQQFYVCEGLAGWVVQGGGTTTINNLGDADAPGTVALSTHQQTWTSALNSAGANITLTNTTADLTSDVSFMDLKYTDDGDLNGFFLRGYDNAAVDLKWAINSDGAFTGLSFTADPSATPAFTQSDSNGITVSTNFQVDGNLTDTGTGTEDYDVNFVQDINGTPTNFITADADGSVTVARLLASSATLTTLVNIPNSATDDTLATAGDMALNTTDEQLSFHSAADGAISGEASISLIRHWGASFDPAGMYDQESTFRAVHVMDVGADSPEGITLTEIQVRYLGGNPTTELNANLTCDTTPDYDTAGGNTVMDVIDTTTGAFNATTFDSASCATGSIVFIDIDVDPADANVMVAVDIWFYNDED